MLVKTEFQSVHLTFAGQRLLTLKPNNFLSTLVQLKENAGLGIWVQLQAPELTMRL